MHFLHVRGRVEVIAFLKRPVQMRIDRFRNGAFPHAGHTHDDQDDIDHRGV
jgi:hypothetical protein